LASIFVKPLAVTAALIVLLPAIYCAQNSAAPVASAPPSAETLNLKLDRRIPPPDPSKYKHIQDASNWANPFLTIGADEFQLTCKAQGMFNKRILPSELARTLVSLPVSSWPYGRVVAAAPAGVTVKENVTKVACSLNRLLKKFDQLIARYPLKRSAMVPLLLYAQDEVGHVSEEVIAEVARRVDVRPIEVVEVIGYLLHAPPPAGG
jgi:hypothetical protein